MGKRLSDTDALCAPSGNDYASSSVEVRKIDNGYVRRQTISDSDGYKTNETYHKSHPGMVMDGDKGAPAEHRAGKSQMSDATKYLSKK